MRKKSILGYLGLLVLSVVVTYLVSLIEMIFSNSVLYGGFGFPFKFSYSSFFGGGTVNYVTLLFDVLIWLVVLLIARKLLTRILKKS